MTYYQVASGKDSFLFSQLSFKTCIPLHVSSYRRDFDSSKRSLSFSACILHFKISLDVKKNVHRSLFRLVRPSEKTLFSTLLSALLKNTHTTMLVHIEEISTQANAPCHFQLAFFISRFLCTHKKNSSLLLLRLAKANN